MSPADRLDARDALARRTWRLVEVRCTLGCEIGDVFETPAGAVWRNRDGLEDRVRTKHPYLLGNTAVFVADTQPTDELWAACRRHGRAVVSAGDLTQAVTRARRQRRAEKLTAAARRTP